VIVSLLYRATRALLSVPAVLLRRDTGKDAEQPALRHENAVLPRQVTRRIRSEPVDRFWFAALSSLLPHHCWSSTFPIIPGTLLARHRRLILSKSDFTARRRRTSHPSVYHGRGQDIGAALGAGEPAVGTPQDSGRVGSTGASDRAVHSLEDRESSR
jgi:hypothetical protein